MFSALPSNSDIARCSRHVSKVPEADIDASLLRRVEPFQMVQLICRAARFWIAFVQSCDPYLPHLKYRWTALRSPYAMTTPGRHRPLAQDAWNESAVRVAIEEIAADAIAHFHPRHLLAGSPE